MRTKRGYAAMIQRVSRVVWVMLLFTCVGSVAQAQQQKPNILIIWGDDIGVHNISAYNHGIMGYRLADHYQPAC